MGNRNHGTKTDTTKTQTRWRGPAVAAAAVAVVLPLTAFAGIGAWNGVQRVMLGTAVETAPITAAELAPARETEPRTRQERREGKSTSGKAGFLGVSTTGLTDQLRDRFDVPRGHGVMISEITDNSAAYLAGLEAGDIITDVNGTTISSSSDLSRAIRRAGADSTVAIEVYRDGRAQILDATLQAASTRTASYSWRSDDGDSDDWDTSNWNNGDWSPEGIEAFAERMAEFGERWGEIGAQFGEMGAEIGAQFGEGFAENFEQNAEAWAERMEAWGEEFGRRMEAKFENGEWDERSFSFNHDGDFDSEEFEEIMHELHERLEGLNLEGIGQIVEEAMQGVNWESLGADVSAAVEEAMKALDNER